MGANLVEGAGVSPAFPFLYINGDLVEVNGMGSLESKTKILVVEDEADIQQVLCVFLKHSGFEVRSASNGQEAIQAITEFAPHLVVLDLVMQPVSGWEVLHWLRLNGHTPPLPVLVMTALTNLTHQVRGFEEGAIEYMTKPTQPIVLVKHINSILSLSAEQRMLLWHKRKDEKRKVLERLNAPELDEFVY
jgi:DNA-binding response OmpR family regulator